jgi:hypothetical protein
MSDSTSPRSGFNVSLILSIIGIGLGGVALYLELTSDPFEPRGSGSPFRNALDRYQEELKTPGGTAKAELDMQLNRDIRAQTEYRTLFEEKQLKEKTESFKIEKDERFTREPNKDPKAKKDKGTGTGEFSILFATYKEDNADKKELIVMEKFTIPTPDGKERDLWKRSNALSSAQVGEKNKELAAEMDKWK